MGRKSKAEEYGLVELIVKKWKGGQKTICYVTEEVNKWLEENGYQITLSDESVRRVIKTHKQELEDVKKAVEAAKAMAAVLKDYPATEVSEVALMQMATLIAEDIREIDSIKITDINEATTNLSRIAHAQARLSDNRVKAAQALDRAKTEIKTELKNAIKNDAELLNKLYEIVDKVEVR